MRIAITADPEVPVPPLFYGGIERVIDLLVRGLNEQGHDVTLFAHPDSKSPAFLRPYPGQRSRSPTDRIRNLLHVSRNVAAGRYDLIHSFGRLAYLLPLIPLPIPKLMSYQRPLPPSSI